MAIYEHVLWNNILCHATRLKKCEISSCAIFQKFDTEELNRAVASFIQEFMCNIPESRVCCQVFAFHIPAHFPSRVGGWVCALVWPSCCPTPPPIPPAALASLLFDLPDPQSIGKTQWRRAHVSSFFYLFSFDCVSFSLLVFSSLLSCLHIVGSLTCKLPFIRIFCTWSLLKFCDHFFEFWLMVDHVF